MTYTDRGIVIRPYNHFQQSHVRGDCRLESHTLSSILGARGFSVLPSLAVVTVAVMVAVVVVVLACLVAGGALAVAVAVVVVVVTPLLGPSVHGGHIVDGHLGPVTQALVSQGSRGPEVGVLEGLAAS